MTELSEKLNALYKEYGEASPEKRSRGFGDLFKGWFSGNGRPLLPDDSRFISSVEKLTDKIAEEGDAEDALSASLLILSRPQTKRYGEQGVVYAAMYKNAVKLVPMLSEDGLRQVSEAAAKVPRQYRFPVYKELVNKLAERLDELSD